MSRSGSLAGGPGLTALLAVASLGAVAVVAIPVVLIRPFSPQTPAGVELAYHLRRVSPAVTALGLAVAVLVSVLRLRSPGRLAGRVGLAFALALCGVAAWFARQNHFEWMFRPLPSAAYARAEQASFVDDADMVIAVELLGDAVAYPVRQMAYHHLLNDQVGGVPVVSTY